MEVRIAVQHTGRELVLESAQTGDQITEAVQQALDADDGLLVLVDERGRRVIVPVDRLAFIDIGEEAVRKVGFGSR